MKLEFKNISENQHLLPKQVYSYITAFDQAKRIKVAEIDPLYADGDSLSRVYGISYDMELNCLIVEGRRGENKSYAAVVIPYGKRANMNSKVRTPLNAKSVSFADLNYVTEVTGMEYGAITPIGLPDDWRILVDESVFEQEYVIVGGGLAKSKLMLPSDLFKIMPNCIVVEGLAKE